MEDVLDIVFFQDASNEILNLTRLGNVEHFRE